MAPYSRQDVSFPEPLHGSTIRVPVPTSVLITVILSVLPLPDSARTGRASSHSVTVRSRIRSVLRESTTQAMSAINLRNINTERVTDRLSSDNGAQQ